MADATPRKLGWWTTGALALATAAALAVAVGAPTMTQRTAAASPAAEAGVEVRVAADPAVLGELGQEVDVWLQGEASLERVPHGAARIADAEVEATGWVRLRVHPDDASRIRAAQAAKEPVWVSASGEWIGDRIAAQEAMGLHDCYQALLKRDREATGRVVVDVAIKGGVGDKAVLALDTLRADAAFEDCVMAEVDTWLWPAGIDGRVKLPLVFEPGPR